MIELDRNPTPEKLGAIAVGDSVHIKTKRTELLTFDRSQKKLACRVTHINGSHVTGLVETVYLYTTGTSQESKSDPYIGQTLSFDKSDVHFITKKTSLMDWVRGAAFLALMLLLLRYCGEQGGENCYRPHPRAAEICD